MAVYTFTCILTVMKTTAAARAHEQRVAALQAELAECEARGTAVGRLMAANVRRDLAVIEARWALRVAS